MNTQQWNKRQLITVPAERWTMKIVKNIIFYKIHLVG